MSSVVWSQPSSVAAKSLLSASLPRALLEQWCADAGLQACSKATLDRMRSLLLGFLQRLLGTAWIIAQQGGFTERICVRDVAAALDVMHRLDAAELRWIPRLVVHQTFKFLTRQYTHAELVELREAGLLDLTRPSAPTSDMGEQLAGLACAADDLEDDDAEEKVEVRFLLEGDSDKEEEEDDEGVGARHGARDLASVPAPLGLRKVKMEAGEGGEVADDEGEEEVLRDNLVEQFKDEYREARRASLTPVKRRADPAYVASEDPLEPAADGSASRTLVEDVVAKEAEGNLDDDDDDDDEEEDDDDDDEEEDDDDDEDDDEEDDEEEGEEEEEGRLLFGAAEAKAAVAEVVESTAPFNMAFTEEAYAGLARVLREYVQARLLAPEPQSVRMTHYASQAAGCKKAELSKTRRGVKIQNLVKCIVGLEEENDIYRRAANREDRMGAEKAWQAHTHNMHLARGELGALVADLRRNLVSAGVAPAVVTRSLQALSGFTFDVPARLSDCEAGGHVQARGLARSSMMKRKYAPSAKAKKPNDENADAKQQRLS